MRGNALRLDFDFQKGGGYAVARRVLPFDLPENYRFHLRVRGETAPQNFEFKLVDSTEANVWWLNRRDFAFPAAWETLTTRKRQISFAWGPAGGGEIRRVAAIEFAITAGSGGSGTVWLDELTLEPLPPPRDVPLPIVTIGSSQANDALEPARTVDGDTATAWRSGPGDLAPALTLDLGELREFGGLVVDLPARPGEETVGVALSEDGVLWRPVWEMRGSRERHYLYLPESEARFVRLLRAGQPGDPPAPLAISEVAVQPLAWSATMNDFLQAVARDHPRGYYPRGLSGEMVYWTVVGTDGGPEVLLSEDGMIEMHRRGFSIEPFLHVDGRLFTWADFVAEQGLADGYLPLPHVTMLAESVELRIEARAPLYTGNLGHRGSLDVSYTLRNRSARSRKTELHLAIRPFQVNPPFQFLGRPAGAAPIRTIARGRFLVVNDSSEVHLSVPHRFCASSSDEGELVDYLQSAREVESGKADDALGRCWSVASYAQTLAPGAEVGYQVSSPAIGPSSWGPSHRERRVESISLEAPDVLWRARIPATVLAGPPAANDALETMRAQIGYVLVNRDGPAIQPGSRAYDRTWIRDGSLTCTALLRLGYGEEVKDFLEWFAPYQYANGKIPCCVDDRGADPVPEHDSTGEFIYLVAEYLRYTGDLDLVRSLWPAVESGVAYLDSLREMRRTAEWRTPENAHFFGLLPPSISHEGYSAEPMHSYWDDFFAVRGFRDAVYLAEVLGRSGEARKFRAISAEFERDLAASIDAAMQVHGVEYVPGAADLGDFDATSTTIVLSPVQAEGIPPDGAVERTFERYYEFFRRRRDGLEEWDAFTPYEMRNIGAFIRLGWRERAAELVDFFMQYRRPAGWKQWAEVVYRDERKAAFIGDMPHTWVGTDYVRSLLDAFAYDREADQSLVVGAGLPRTWTEEAPGVRVNGLHTVYGPLHYSMREEGGAVTVRIEEGLRVPPGGIRVAAPGVSARSRARANGRAVPVESDGCVIVRSLPADIRIEL